MRYSNYGLLPIKLPLEDNKNNYLELSFKQLLFIVYFKLIEVINNLYIIKILSYCQRS
jgi:hypothetical protein